jgi:hypothetical protein
MTLRGGFVIMEIDRGYPKKFWKISERFSRHRKCFGLY